ncbi:MAG: pyrroline-5-carboxylate reductase, partial [Promicromonosporaceae bacterium]|nr:pyrroline-5-carboxylate reductase [Promicromonosporaceae bacterium]
MGEAVLAGALRAGVPPRNVAVADATTGRAAA